MSVWPSSHLQQLASATLDGRYLHTLVAPANALGLPVAAALQQTGLCMQALQGPVSLLRAWQLLDYFDRHAEPGWAFHLGLTMRPASAGALGYLLLGAATLEQAIQRLVRYERCVWDIGLSQWQAAEQRLVFMPTLSPLPASLAELCLTSWLAVGRLLAPQAQAKALCLRHTPVLPSATIEALLGVPLRTAQTDYALELADGHSQQPLPLADDLLEQSLLPKVINKAAQQPHLQAIRQRMVAALPEGAALEQVAASLGQSPRQLRHTLHLHDLSYQHLLQDLRQALTEHYLRQTTLSLTEISFLLGFAEQSSFSRAFRQWHGCTAQQYREAYSVSAAAC